MKKILYITNIEVPYRVKFFNELAKYCDLTVLYERSKSSNRDDSWSSSEKINYKALYLDGIKIKNENSFSLKILKFILKKYDDVIIGCYNSPIQMFAIMIMNMLKKPYILNIDGEIFINKDTFKDKIKKYFLSGAKKYLVAGEKAAKSLEKIISNKDDIIVYYFSSLTDEEIKNHAISIVDKIKSNEILVIGQYFNYKGMDIALKVAKLNKNIRYKFVGMGKRTALFEKIEDVSNLNNVICIPFLSKEKLEEEYKKCKMLLLPTRQECWGLVINEAASFGVPIVSTWGSGAAVEFLSDKYSQYLAQPNDVDGLYKCVERLLSNDDQDYREYLLEKSKSYSIEVSVKKHIKCLNL